MKKINIGYVRVSTDEQAKYGHSLDYQKDKILLKSKLDDIRDIEIYADDGQSGRTLERKQLKKVLKLIEDKKVEFLIVLKLDRLTRSITDLNYLLELCVDNEVTLISIQEEINLSTAFGRFFINIQGIMAQFESEQISERTKTGLIAKAKKKQYPFGNKVPFGYEKDENDQLIENAKEIKIIKEIYDKYVIENYSEIKVHDYIYKKYKKKLFKKHIADLLVKTIYQGYIVIANEKIEIIDKPIFTQDDIKYLEKRRTVTSYSKHEYAFRNKVYINGNLAKHTKKVKKSGKEYNYYFHKKIYVNENIIKKEIDKKKKIGSSINDSLNNLTKEYVLGTIDEYEFNKLLSNMKKKRKYEIEKIDIVKEEDCMEIKIRFKN